MMARCPLCPNPLRPNIGTLVRCVRGHRFNVVWADEGSETERELELATNPVEQIPDRKGARYPLPDDAEFTEKGKGKGKAQSGK